MGDWKSEMTGNVLEPQTVVERVDKGGEFSKETV